MKTFIFIFFILTILGCSSKLNVNKTENEQIDSFDSDYKVLVLDGVNVIDGTGAPVKFSMSITIENGKITAIEKQGEKKISGKSENIETR